MGALLGIGASLYGQDQARKARDKQYAMEQKYQRDQWMYNEDSANRAQVRNMAMWDYTNYENQKKHMQAAGLNPALMYGQGGGGGASTGGTQAAATGMQTPQGEAIGTAKQGMALQAANLVSQTAVNRASAKKMEAEADKIKGVDTEATKVDTEFKSRITKLQDTVEKVMNSQEQLNLGNFHLIQSEERKVWAETRSALVKADVDEATKDETVRMAALSNWNSTLKGLETISRTTLNEEQVNKLKNDMAVAWAHVALGEKSVSNQADEIANKLFLGLKDLDRKEQELLKDWIYEGVHAGKEISGEVLNWLTRGIGKNVTEVSGKLEEIFNSEGKVIQTKTTQNQTTRTMK